MGALKSRAPSRRFLSQETLGAPEGHEGPVQGGCHLLERCLSGIEAVFTKTWKEGEACKGKSGGGGASGPPGRLWGLALSSGSCGALLAAPDLTILCPSGALPDAEASGAHMEDKEDEAFPGWAPLGCTGNMGLAAVNNVSGTTQCVDGVHVHCVFKLDI